MANGPYGSSHTLLRLLAGVVRNLTSPTRFRTRILALKGGPAGRRKVLNVKEICLLCWGVMITTAGEATSPIKRIGSSAERMRPSSRTASRRTFGLRVAEVVSHQSLMPSRRRRETRLRHLAPPRRRPTLRFD